MPVTSNVKLNKFGFFLNTLACNSRPTSSCCEINRMECVKINEIPTNAVLSLIYKIYSFCHVYSLPSEVHLNMVLTDKSFDSVNKEGDLEPLGSRCHSYVMLDTIGWEPYVFLYLCSFFFTAIFLVLPHFPFLPWSTQHVRGFQVVRYNLLVTHKINFVGLSQPF